MRLLGFTDRMSDLLAAADALIHSTAGLTVLEAQIRGCPAISYGFAVGHIRANNRAYERFGLARVATSRGDLAAALREALAEHPEPDQSFASLPSPATLAIEARPRVKPLPIARLRATRARHRRRRRLRPRRLRPRHRLHLPALRPRPRRRHDEVGRDQPARRRRPRRRPRRQTPRASRGSWTPAASRPRSPSTARPPSTPSASSLQNGDEPMPRIDSGGVLHSFGTGGRLAQQAKSLGLDRPFYYEPPPDGKTTLQALLAKSAGGHAVGGEVKASATARPSPSTPASSSRSTSRRHDPDEALSSLSAGLDSAGLSGVSLSSLAKP